MSDEYPKRLVISGHRYYLWKVVRGMVFYIREKGGAVLCLTPEQVEIYAQAEEVRRGRRWRRAGRRR